MTLKRQGFTHRFTARSIPKDGRYYLFIEKKFKNTIPLSAAIEENPRIAKAAAFVEKLHGRKLPETCRIKTCPSFSDISEIIRSPLGYSIDCDIAYLGPGAISGVHELTHVQDKEPESEIKRQIAPREDETINHSNPVNFLYLEGRAVFAETLYRLGDKWKAKSARYLNLGFGVMAAGFCGMAEAILFRDTLLKFFEQIEPIGRLIPNIFKSPEILNSFKFPDIVGYVGLGMFFTGAAYWFFHNSICTLAEKVGDPIKAFRISGSKVPKRILDVVFPTRFYKEEIDKAIQEKNNE